MNYRLKNGASVIKHYLIEQDLKKLQNKFINTDKSSTICQMQQFFNIINDFFLGKNVELMEIKYVFN
jgi:hypothetical protein